MEESIMQYMKQRLGIKKVDLRTYSPLTLAYIVDSVFDVIVKTILVSKANMQVNKYHKKASSIVKAHAQAEMMNRLEAHLTEEEQDIYKRGRNATSYTKAKNASMIDYRRATGLEALVGYLYLKEDYTRLIDLLQIGLEQIDL